MSNDEFQNQYLVRTDAKNTISPLKILGICSWFFVLGALKNPDAGTNFEERSTKYKERITAGYYRLLSPVAVRLFDRWLP